MPHFSYTSMIPLSLDEVWDFHAAEGALSRMIPPKVPVRVLHYDYPPNVGSRVVLEITLMGMQFEWIARHTEWQPPRLFVDEQEKGPFRQWTHRHRFEAVPSGTQVIDEICFNLPGGFLADWLFGWAVKIALHRAFGQRHRILRKELVKT